MKLRNLMFLFVFAFVAMSVLSSSAMASAVYGQRFQEDGNYSGGHYNVTKIEGFMLAPPQETWALKFDNFSVAGWSGQQPNPTYTFGEGPATGYIQWDLAVTPTLPAVFDLLVWGRPDAGGDVSLAGSTRVTWDGNGFSYGAGSTSYGDVSRAAVPEPASLGMLGGGMLGLVAMLRRKRKAT
jgi:hypothetical protein